MPSPTLSLRQLFAGNAALPALHPVLGADLGFNADGSARLTLHHHVGEDEAILAALATMGHILSVVTRHKTGAMHGIACGTVSVLTEQPAAIPTILEEHGLITVFQTALMRFQIKQFVNADVLHRHALGGLHLRGDMHDNRRRSGGRINAGGKFGQS